ncbi:MAG: glycosyltransferase family 2 protein [Bacteroidota bacterium]
MPDKVEKIAMGLGTFKRPKMLSDTLRSLSEIELPENTNVTLVLADNDKEATAEEVFEQFKPQFPFEARYLVVEERGIINMRNRVLEEALSLNADYITFVDDDERVKPEWLKVMLHTLKQYDADVVDGAVERILPEETPPWVVKGKFLEWHNFKTGSLRQSGSTSNIIFKRKIIDEYGLRFHPALNFAGASDTFLFKQAALKGAKIVWLNERLVHEYFPPSRVTRQWILKRAFRRTNSKFIRNRLEHGYPRAAFTMFFEGIFQLVAGGLLSVLSLPFGQIARVHAQRIFMKGLGTFNGIFGGVYEEYKNTHGH